MTEVGGASSRQVSLYYTTSLVSFTMTYTYFQLHDEIGRLASRLCVRAFCCYLQASISSVIKDAYSRYDLGLLEIGDPANICIFWPSLKQGRLPPLSPASMAQKLADEKEFTNQSDVKKVVKLYASFFETVSSSIQELKWWT